MAVSLVSTGVTFPDNSTQTTAATGFGFKNRILNGQMVIDQRNAGASVTSSFIANVFCVDRWFGFSTSPAVFTMQQSIDAPSGFINSVVITVTTQDTSLASGDFNSFRYIIEGLNVADFGWGTASAQPITLSFWVKSSLTGTFTVGFRNSAINRSYIATYTISAANTWEQKTITIAGDTSGTWLTTNGIGIRLDWSLGSGSDFQGTAGSWTATNDLTTAGAVSVVGTSGATFYITGVQLEKGSTATSFDYRPYGTELQLAQRYFQTSYSGSAVGTATSTNSLYLAAPGTGNYQGIQIGLPVSMRTAPTVVSYSTTGVSGKFRAAGADVTTTTTNTAINYIFIYASNSAITISQDINTHYTASSEL